MDKIGYYFSLVGIGYTTYGKIYLRFFTITSCAEPWEKDRSLFSIKFYAGHFLDIELFGKTWHINFRKRII